jgi:ribosome-interacting GTPase 1
MPANLPPQYFEAEQRFREARTPAAKIEVLEEMLAIMPKHKGTDKLKAMLRERISKLREQGQKKAGGAKAKSAYSIEREGIAQAVLTGAPNTGKSSLLNRLTKATAEVGDFPHTTHRPTPGMAPFENVQIQLIDTPPVTLEYTDPELGDLLRRTDIVVVLLDLQGDPLTQLEETLAILCGFRIFPESHPLPPDLKKIPFVKTMLVAVNKMDRPEDEADFDTFLELSGVNIPALGISAKTGRNLMALLERLFGMSGVTRVYTRRPGKEPDMTAPFVIPRGSTVAELAEMIHKDFVAKLKHARIWGRAVRDGQMVQRDYALQDGDVVELCV